ncbi:MAG: hypothetical protein R3298_04695 [Gammaproteobacteria bacterium]|nr:hypothetical protein [Gammaproteobacteria bacterium]
MAKEKTHWLDRPRNVRKVYLAVWVACGLLLVAELFVDKHGEVGIEHWFGFHGWYGFIACVALVIVAKALRRLLFRPEDYYDAR